MKSILAFFFIAFLSLGAGIYFYETQIASPRSAGAVVKAEKKALAKKLTESAEVIKKPSLPTLKNTGIITAVESPSRVIDLLAYDSAGKKKTTEQVRKSQEINRSIKSAIKKSTSLDIQKAVVTEISKKR